MGQLLTEMRDEGLVVREGDRWRLSDRTEEKYGQALRGLSTVNDDDEERVY